MIDLNEGVKKIGRAYLAAIRDSTNNEDIISAQLLSDEFAQFLIDTVQNFNEVARDIEALKTGSVCENEFTKMAEMVRRQGQKYLALSNQWSEYQKKGIAPTAFPGFAELENIANGKD